MGYILSDQCDRLIKAAVFNDRYRTEIIDRREFTGCILKQMDGVLSFISKYNRKQHPLSGGHTGRTGRIFLYADKGCGGFCDDEP